MFWINRVVKSHATRLIPTLCAFSDTSAQINEISSANSRQNIRKLVKDGFVIRKPTKVCSQFFVNADVIRFYFVLRSTRVLARAVNRRRNALVAIRVTVSVEVLAKPGCRPKYFGLDVIECFEDYSKSTETRKKSTSICTTRCT